MIPISERLHIKRLKLNNISIEERYLNPDTNEILTRSITENRCDNITGCIKLEKEYFLNGKSIYIEKEFNQNARYTFLQRKGENTKIECPSCGYKGKSKEFSSGCPYCNTDFNVEFSRERNDKKKSVWRYTPTGVLFFATIFLIHNLGIIPTNALYLIILLMLLVYLITAIVLILTNISSDIKEKDVWNEFKTLGMNINEQKVYNNLHLQLCNYYYDKKNTNYKDLIDFDIYEYHTARYDKDGNKTYIILPYTIRKYYLEKEEIKTTLSISEVKLLMNKNIKHKEEGIFTIRCKNCGSPISIEESTCKYCKSKNHSVLGWILESFIYDDK